MPFVNPYESSLEGRDPRDVMEASVGELARLVRDWPAGRYDATYAPGKWTGRQILLHLSHVEMIDGVRLRMALSEPDYVVQPFTPDAWVHAEEPRSGPEVLAEFHAMRRMNLGLWRAVPPHRWRQSFRHPECGTMTLEDLAAICAGHELHHLVQLRRIGQQ
jgi:DinB family protein